MSRGRGRLSRSSWVGVVSSSSMISLQRSMHSSQMYTPGPAISFLTCFCDLPQKLHFKRSPPSPNFATVPPALSGDACDLRHCRELAILEDFVDEPVVPRLVGAHDEVPVRVLRDLLHRLPAVVGEDRVEQVAQPQDLPSLDLDVGCLPPTTAVRLVDEDAGVRQREPL